MEAERSQNCFKQVVVSEGNRGTIHPHGTRAAGGHLCLWFTDVRGGAVSEQHHSGGRQERGKRGVGVEKAPSHPLTPHPVPPSPSFTPPPPPLLPYTHTWVCPNRVCREDRDRREEVARARAAWAHGCSVRGMGPWWPRA